MVNSNPTNNYKFLKSNNLIKLVISLINSCKRFLINWFSFGKPYYIIKSREVKFI